MRLNRILEMADIQSAKGSAWFKALSQKADVYFVGGAVRDELLGKVSKDVDIVVKDLSIDDIAKLLKPFGKVNLVGKSFGVLKFKPKGESEEIDVAVPRTETKTGTGHKGFDITPDENLDIIKDLERRDFTINAIAKDKNGDVVDPFGGREDAKKKVIRAVSNKTFSDDPLRMLRAVQFAARFGFTIESETLAMIKKTAPKIREISGERIVIEFDKILRKGDPVIGAKLLKETGLHKNFFGIPFIADPSEFKLVRTMGEFAFLLLKAIPEPEKIWQHKLKGDSETAAEMVSLKEAQSVPATKTERRLLASRILARFDVSRSKLIPPAMAKTLKELKGSKYPSGRNQLAVNGRDLQKAGYKGKEIGDILLSLLTAVYADRIKNTKQELLASL